MDPADLPPTLEWEEPVWKLYERISTQWRTGFSGRTGLDYNVAISLAGVRGWDVDLTTELLRVIEIEILKQDAKDDGPGQG